MTRVYPKQRYAVFGLSLCMLLAACGGASSESVADDCELLTNEEVTALAGFEVVAGEDTPLGCPFTRPGDLTARVTVGSAESSEDATSVARRGYPQAADIVAVDGLGDDTVAVLTPTGDTVAAVVAARDGRFVEIGMFMLGVEPDDMEGIRAAAKLAVVAVARL